MLAYKYRSIGNAHQVFDILINRRLRCARWQELNDPMEGYFELTGRNVQESRAIIDGILDAKANFRVCSMSLSAVSPLLWAHYADGFAGLAVEVEIPDPLRLNDNRFTALARREVPFVAHVNYRAEIAVAVDGLGDRRELASRILLSKYRAWDYEEEVRVISREDWFPVRPVRLIAGPRLEPALFAGLERVCAAEGVQICRLRVSHDGLRLPRRSRR